MSNPLDPIFPLPTGPGSIGGVNAPEKADPRWFSPPPYDAGKGDRQQFVTGIPLGGKFPFSNPRRGRY
jgi:hypothetical protein